MEKLTKITGFKTLSTFYLISGLIFTFLFIQSGLTLAHLGLLGILGIVTFYGLYAKSKWAIYLTIPVSLLGITFAAVTLYIIPSLLRLTGAETTAVAAVFLYMLILVISILYLAIKRDELRETKEANSE